MRRSHLATLWIFLIWSIELWGQVIDEYTVRIQAESNATVHVQEEILYDYQSDYEEGFVRILPLIVKHSRFQFSTSDDEFQVEGLKITRDDQPTHFSVTKAFSARHGPYLRIFIGNTGDYISGKHRYRLDYNLSNAFYPVDSGKNRIIRWELPSDERKAPIERFRLDVSLPEDWNRSSVTIAGKIGKQTIDPNRLRWIAPSRFTLELASIPAHTPISIDAKRPASGTFGANEGSTTAKVLIVDVLPLIVLGAYLLWLRYIKRRYRPSSDLEEASISVHYSPPEGMGFLHSAFLYSDGIGAYTLLPAIVDLAQKGYLQIKRKNKRYEFIKTRGVDPSRLTEGERYLYEGILFPLDTERFVMEDPNDPKMKRRLHRKLKILIDKIQEWALQEGYYTRSAGTARKKFLTQALLIVLLVSIPFGLGISFLKRETDSFSFLFNTFAFYAIAPLYGLVISAFVKVWQKMSIGWGITGFLFLGFLLFISTSTFYPACHTLQEALWCLPLWVVGLIVYLNIHTYFTLTTRTPKGQQVYEHLLGFREFITGVESERISQALQKNPFYADPLLPYVMFFDYNRSWGEFYDEIKYELPFWFHKNNSDYDGSGD